MEKHISGPPEWTDFSKVPPDNQLQAYQLSPLQM